MTPDSARGRTIRMLARPIAWLGVVLLASAMATARQQPFVARAEVVRVDVLVTAGAQILPGLTAADFEVFDNGVRQHVSLVALEEQPVNVVLALDVSSSVAGEKLGQLRAAAAAALGHLKPADKAGLVTFSSVLSSRIALTSDAARVLAGLDQPQNLHDTALVDASFAAMLLSESDTGRPLVIVFTDGLDTASFLSPSSVVDSARRSTAVVYAVVSGLQGRSRFLYDLCAQTGGRVVDIRSLRDLERTFVTVLDEFRDRYVLGYTPAGVQRNGWHQLDVRVNNRRATVKARPGYFKN